MNLPAVKQLKYLSLLAEHLDFGRAAQACFVSQSALSAAITELEQNLGVTLFEEASTILLTPIGERLIGITFQPEMAVKANITHDTDAEIRRITTRKDLSRTFALVWRKKTRQELKNLKR